MELTPKQRAIKAAMDRHDDAGVEALGPSDADIDAVAQATIGEKGATVQPRPQVSAGRAAALGMSQGGSAGLADEIASQVVPAAINRGGLGHLAADIVAPGVIPDNPPARMTPAAMAYWKKVNPQDAAHAEWINKQYEVTPESVQRSQSDELGLAQEQHPVAYGASRMAASLPMTVAAGPEVAPQMALGAVEGAGSAQGDVSDRLAGGAGGAAASGLGAMVGGGLTRGAAGISDNVANGISRGMMDIPPEEALRLETNGMMPKVVANVRENLGGGGGRLGVGRRIAAQNQPVGESIEDLLSAEAATGDTVDGASIADRVGNRAGELERSGTYSQRNEAAPGMRYYEDVMRRQSTDFPATGSPKSAVDVWNQRKDLDQAADFGGRPGMPNNPDLARAQIRPVIDDQLHEMVKEPSKLAQLNSLEDTYHTGATAKKYMLDAAAKVGGQGSYVADTASAMSAMGESNGRSILSSLSKPSREAAVIKVGNIADYAAKKLQGVPGAQVGSAMANTKLAQILQSVASSPDPDMEDYLYREMYPEYGAAMITAEDEMKKAPKDSADIETMGNNMRKLQGM